MSPSDRPGGIATRLLARSTNLPQPAEPDAITLERARSRDLAAFEQLHRAYVGRVYGLCLRLCGDAGRAEDLVQDVFLRVWQKIETFEGRSRFTTWLYRLTVNRVTDAMRAELSRMGSRATVELTDELPAATAPAPDSGLDLEGAIRKLPAGARLVFVLHDVEGYGHEEIAGMAGIAEGTSKSQLYRARRLLREMLSR
jgi:RNA polymerase sigma-70 factor (ECF subfamily)